MNIQGGLKVVEKAIKKNLPTILCLGLHVLRDCEGRTEDR